MNRYYHEIIIQFAKAGKGLAGMSKSSVIVVILEGIKLVTKVIIQKWI